MIVSLLYANTEGKWGQFCTVCIVDDGSSSRV